MPGLFFIVLIHMVGFFHHGRFWRAFDNWPFPWRYQGPTVYSHSGSQHISWMLVAVVLSLYFFLRNIPFESHHQSKDYLWFFLTSKWSLFLERSFCILSLGEVLYAALCVETLSYYQICSFLAVLSKRKNNLIKYVTIKLLP